MSYTSQSRRGLVNRILLYPAAAATILTAGPSIVTPSLSASPFDRDDDRRDGTTTFTVDISQDAATNKQANVNPNQGQDVFSIGDFFNIAGTVFPDGTIPRGQPGNDPNAPGGIGSYRIRGTFTINVADFTRAVEGHEGAPPILAFATEIFSLPDDANTIITDGLWANAYFNARRVVVGGTGRFAGVIGEALEQNIGENAGGFCNLRVTFKLRKL
jgi:hypothetical protein